MKISKNRKLKFLGVKFLLVSVFGSMSVRRWSCESNQIIFESWEIKPAKLKLNYKQVKTYFRPNNKIESRRWLGCGLSCRGELEKVSSRWTGDWKRKKSLSCIAFYHRKTWKKKLKHEILNYFWNVNWMESFFEHRKTGSRKKRRIIFNQLFLFESR